MDTILKAFIRPQKIALHVGQGHDDILEYKDINATLCKKVVLHLI